MDKNNITSVKIPAGAFCGHNCSDGCIYWNPLSRTVLRGGVGSNVILLPDPRERQGCLSYED